MWMSDQSWPEGGVWMQRHWERQEQLRRAEQKMQEKHKSSVMLLKTSGKTFVLWAIFELKKIDICSGKLSSLLGNIHVNIFPPIPHSRVTGLKTKHSWHAWHKKTSHYFMQKWKLKSDLRFKTKTWSKSSSRNWSDDLQQTHQGALTTAQSGSVNQKINQSYVL